MPLLAWSQAKQAFATCNERDLDAGRELSKAPAAPAIPATPLSDFARHCYTNLVRNIIIQNCISRLHSGISAPWSHIVIAAVIQNDVVAG